MLDFASLGPVPPDGRLSNGQLTTIRNRRTALEAEGKCCASASLGPVPPHGRLSNGQLTSARNRNGYRRWLAFASLGPAPPHGELSNGQLTSTLPTALPRVGQRLIAATPKRGAHSALRPRLARRLVTREGASVRLDA